MCTFILYSYFSPHLKPTHLRKSRSTSQYNFFSFVSYFYFHPVAVTRLSTHNNTAYLYTVFYPFIFFCPKKAHVTPLSSVPFSLPFQNEWQHNNLIETTTPHQLQFTTKHKTANFQCCFFSALCCCSYNNHHHSHTKKKNPNQVKPSTACTSQTASIPLAFNFSLLSASLYFCRQPGNGNATTTDIRELTQ